MSATFKAARARRRYHDPEWDRTLTFPFGRFTEIAGGETISTVTASGTTGLTAGTPQISGTNVLWKITGGTPGTVYYPRLKVVTSGNATLAIELPLHVT